MSNSNRVLGRILSTEQCAAVSGGDPVMPPVTTTPSSDDTGMNESFGYNEYPTPWPTTPGNDSGVWGEGYQPEY